MRYYEDIEVGDTREFGSYEVTESAVVEFAEQYDPQPFHTDPEAAADTHFGGLVASGWHTAAMTMRMLVDNVVDERAGLGARGVDELRWHRPVRPGDVLSVRTEVLDKRRSESDPERGYVDSHTEVYADGDLVLSFVGLGMVQVRDP